MDRKDPSTPVSQDAIDAKGIDAQGVKTRDVNRMAPYAHSWPDMARLHCEGRNGIVARVLACSIMIRHRHPVGLAGAFVGARWQAPMEIEGMYEIPPEWAQRIEACERTTEDEVNKIKSKFTSRQDAHMLPCEITLNGMALESFLPSQYRAESKETDDVTALAGILFGWGAVDRLPTMFNEGDSHAEACGLKMALLTACQAIPRQTTLSTGLFKEAHRTAFATWLSWANIGFTTALTRNHDARKATSERSYKRVYRDIKIALLEDYRRFTASEIADVKNIVNVLPFYEEFM